MLVYINLIITVEYDTSSWYISAGLYNHCKSCEVNSGSSSVTDKNVTVKSCHDLGLKILICQIRAFLNERYLFMILDFAYVSRR